MPSVNNYMRSQRLDKRIEIFGEVEVKNPTGSVDYQWTKLHTSDFIFARVRYVARTQKEQVYAGKEMAIQEVHFDIRYRSDLDKVKVVRYDNALFDIITLYERGRRQMTTIVTQWRDSESPQLDLG